MKKGEYTKNEVSRLIKLVQENPDLPIITVVTDPTEPEDMSYSIVDWDGVEKARICRLTSKSGNEHIIFYGVDDWENIKMGSKKYESLPWFDAILITL